MGYLDVGRAKVEIIVSSVLGIRGVASAQGLVVSCALGVICCGCSETALQGITAQAVADRGSAGFVVGAKRTYIYQRCNIWHTALDESAGVRTAFLSDVTNTVWYYSLTPGVFWEGDTSGILLGIGVILFDESAEICAELIGVFEATWMPKGLGQNGPAFGFRSEFGHSMRSSFGIVFGLAY